MGCCCKAQAVTMGLDTFASLPLGREDFCSVRCAQPKFLSLGTEEQLGVTNSRETFAKSESVLSCRH